MTHPIVDAIRGMVAQLVPADGIEDIRAIAGEQSLTVEIWPTNDHAAGLIIGKHGQTVEALRHLAARAGRAQMEQIQVSIVVVNPPGGRGR